MDGLLWLLVFGVFFFVMMRYGCGAHMMHGGHKHGSHVASGIEPSSDQDPVCGMSVAPDKGYSMAWSGTTFRFCSRNCLEKFEAGPEEFLATRTSA